MIIMKGHVAPYHTHWCERMTKVMKNRILHHLEKITKKEVRVVHEWNECRPGGS